MSTSPWVILLAVLIYGFVHSLLAASGIKARVKVWFGAGVDRWYRLAYNTFGILTLMPILALVAYLPDNEIYVIPAPWSYIALAGQLLALVVLVIGLLQTGIYSFLGFEQSAIYTVSFYQYYHPNNFGRDTASIQGQAQSEKWDN